MKCETQSDTHQPVAIIEIEKGSKRSVATNFAFSRSDQTINFFNFLQVNDKKKLGVFEVCDYLVAIATVCASIYVYGVSMGMH